MKKHTFDANNSFLAGFFGSSDKVINSLGIILYKPIMSATLSDFTLRDIESFSEIHNYERQTFPVCNQGDKETVQLLN